MDSAADFPWDWTHVTGTLLIKTGGGALHTITINQLTVGDTVEIYDGINNGGGLIGILATGLNQPVTLTYDAKIETGIYIELVGQGPLDLTVNWI